MNKSSAVSFPGTARMHLGLAVKDLGRSLAFYEMLLGQGPSKRRSDYAKFEVEEPRVNLSLIQHPHPTALPLPAHFGIQVHSSEQVVAKARLLQEAGLETRMQVHETCCHAVQDKVWVTDPDGNAWEVFVVLDDRAEEPQRTAASAPCCDPDCCAK